MNLVPIKNYQNYSFDLNSNQVYNTKYKRYLKISSNNNGYYKIRLRENSKDKTFLFHRLVYEIYKGEIPKGLCIDHIDNNTENNNIDNLRLATYSQNCCNRLTAKTNKSTGYKNIRFRNNKYEVNITKNNKKFIYSNKFKTLEEAIENRDIQLKLIHGQFHNLG